MPEKMNPKLFKALDFWASYFLSKDGNSVLPRFLIERMQSLIDSVRTEYNFPPVSSITGLLQEYSACLQDVQIANDSQFNQEMLAYFSNPGVSRELSENGRLILENIRQRLLSPASR